MKVHTKIILGIMAVVIVFAVWYLASPLLIDKVVNESSPIIQQQNETTQEQTLKTASFQDADSFHKTSGQAKVISSGNTRYLRLEEFQTTNGPDLYVYLSKDLQATDFISLGELKGNIGNQNYELSPAVSTEKYPYALIWCKEFSVLFGSAKFE